MKDPLPRFPTVASVRARGRVTVPKAARDELSLGEGDRLLFVVGRGKLEVVPLALVARRELWTLTGSIRGGLEQAEDDAASGRIKEITNPRKLKSALRRLAADEL